MEIGSTIQRRFGSRGFLAQNVDGSVGSRTADVAFRKAGKIGLRGQIQDAQKNSLHGVFGVGGRSSYAVGGAIRTGGVALIKILEGRWW